ncbi:MAG: hypothetical protein GYA24_10795 [Candidatus Lokiarchaeota archaeon]|nr:hypothetical protein [Candidatus Lokiarchaeota archaeon]
MLTTRPSTRQFIAYVLALLVMYIAVAPFKLVGGTVLVNYFILDGYYDYGTASFPASTIAEMVAFGPVMAVVMSWCYAKSIGSWRAAGLMPCMKARILGLLFAMAIVLLNTGLLVNRLFNVVSAQAKAFFDATGLGHDNYVFAYFLDEIVGHHLMNAGFVLFYLVMAIVPPIDPLPFSKPEHALNGGERVLVLVASAVHGIIFSIENLEGQSMVFTLVVMGGMAGAIMIAAMVKRNKMAPLNNPFLLFIVVQLVVMLAFSVVWGLALGVKPYYPFFYEPSEIA